MLQYLIEYQIDRSGGLGVLNVDTDIMDCYNAQLYNKQKYGDFLLVEIFLSY